jgi:single-stranded-DNA-specific exonuclease
MRQQLEMEIFEDAKAQLDADPSLAAGRVIVICGRDYHQGAIGIVASKLLNEYSKPVIVMSSDGEVTRGSARSVDGFNIYEAIAACSDILEQFGGHPKAAGLTVLTSRVDEFRK